MIAYPPTFTGFRGYYNHEGCINNGIIIILIRGVLIRGCINKGVRGVLTINNGYIKLIIVFYMCVYQCISDMRTPL